MLVQISPRLKIPSKAAAVCVTNVFFFLLMLIGWLIECAFEDSKELV